MRIVGGYNRGRGLVSPEGRETRPTSDRARESVFNILAHAGWLERPAVEEALVLDVFAGTGALGFEALSRGAAHAVFMEEAKEAVALCRKNAEALREEKKTLVLPCDATRPPPRPSHILPRTLVFLDPPYGKGLGAEALSALAAKDWLAKEAVCVMEMAKKSPESPPPGFTFRDERVYGVALLRFLTRDA